MLFPLQEINHSNTWPIRHHCPLFGRICSLVVLKCLGHLLYWLQLSLVFRNLYKNKKKSKATAIWVKRGSLRGYIHNNWQDIPIDDWRGGGWGVESNGIFVHTQELATNVGLIKAALFRG